MESLNEYVEEYTKQLQSGKIQKAYKGIMTFMTGLRGYLLDKNPEFLTGALYFGYMDMTYFAFTPIELKKRNLKIAVVYLHEKNRFEIWLGGGNRKVQSEYLEILKKKDLGFYKLSSINPGVDSIIEIKIEETPDFEKPEELMKKIESEITGFTKDIISFVE